MSDSSDEETEMTFLEFIQTSANSAYGSTKRSTLKFVNNYGAPIFKYGWVPFVFMAGATDMFAKPNLFSGTCALHANKFVCIPA